MRLGWSWEVYLYVVVVVVDVDVAGRRLSPPSSRGSFVESWFSYIVDLVSSRIPDAIGIAAAIVVDQDAFVGHGLELSTPLRLVDLAECLATEYSEFIHIWILASPHLERNARHVGDRKDVA